MLIQNYKIDKEVVKESISILIGPEIKWAKELNMINLKPSRMILVDASQEILSPFNGNVDTINVDLELRPNGVLMVLSNKTNSVAWAIPFYHLAIFKTAFWGIHGNGKKIQLHDPKWKNKGFFKFLIQHKNSVAVSGLN